MSVFKDVVEVAGRFLSEVLARGQAAERARFDQRKQEYLMEWITAARTLRGNARRPMPGTDEFAYCEALAKDGAVGREMLSGYYILKGLVSGTDWN